jgi:pSer/pThr/pTyr-binding forkhead associated (FHA) protein
MQIWIIGSGADCDLVVERPTVSGRHCRLTETADGYVIEDLGSSNGTYVNGERIAAARRVSLTDAITLGASVPMPWPAVTSPSDATILRIGRGADNDIVLDDPRVSGHHARLIISGTRTLIEDLGSSNGTFLNSAAERVTQPTSLSNCHTVFFGSLAVPVSNLQVGLPAKPVPVPPSRTVHLPPSPHQQSIDLRSRPGLNKENSWLLAAVVQAPVLALAIVLLWGRQAATAVTVDSWVSVGRAIAATTFALSLAAIWLGGCVAVAELFGGLRPGQSAQAERKPFVMSYGARFAVLFPVCALACAVLLAIVYWGVGLGGPWVAMWVLLAIASTVGLLLGFLAWALVARQQAVALVLLGFFALMIVFGGWLWPLSRSNLPVSLASAAMPSRWTFEGMLLLEAPHHRVPANLGDAVAADNPDLAEEFFPADSERMGVRADAMALCSMLIGLAAATAVSSIKPK